MKTNQKGFTLVELMIVLAIIGIIFAWIVPRYQDYIARTEVAEGIRMADSAKMTILENLQNGNCTDPNAKKDQYPNTIEGSYTKLVISDGDEPQDFTTGNAPNGCLVTITYGQGKDANGQTGKAHKSIKDKILTLKMLNNGSYALNQEETTLPIKYLPKSLIANLEPQDGHTGSDS